MADSSIKEQIDKRIKVFWEQNEKFRNHPLKTEQPNPDTHNLSDLAKDDLQQAVEVIKKVDHKAVLQMLDYLSEMDELKADIQKVLKSGNKIYISGCGASGRLAVAIEYLWNYSATKDKKDKVIGFLGGGDNAMIKSIEGFEDFKDYGIKQLKLAGFKDGDLLIAASASGESPFVLATAEFAAETSIKPWFVHCNTNNSLKGRIKDHVIYNKNVKILSLFTGGMALTGSTRMQATTVLMLGISLPLFEYDIEKQLNDFANIIENLDYTSLPSFIETETKTYLNGEYVFYNIDDYYGITVLTDTTERTPTFNLIPFENQCDKNKKASWSYILLNNAKTSEKAWEKLLGRKSRTLDWNDETSYERLLGFNFSNELVNIRGNYAKPYHFYKIKKENNSIALSFKNNSALFNVSGLTPLIEQLILKLVLNTTSTVMMGRMGYYEGNLMTSLYPSNSKLIDRSIRYTDFILKNKHDITLKYEDIAEKMFKELYKLMPGESIVTKTIDKIIK
jgi:N-acetylmuramic acid 6-phosphate etherase